MEWTILHRFGLAGTNGHQFIKRRNPNVEIRIDDQSQSSKHGFFSRNFRSSGRNRTSVEASAKALDAATVLIPPAKRLRLQLETRKLSGEFPVHQFANLSHGSVAVGGSLITDHQFTGNQGAATAAPEQLSAMHLRPAGAGLRRKSSRAGRRTGQLFRPLRARRRSWPRPRGWSSSRWSSCWRR